MRSIYVRIKFYLKICRGCVPTHPDITEGDDNKLFDKIYFRRRTEVERQMYQRKIHIENGTYTFSNFYILELQGKNHGLYH